MILMIVGISGLVLKHTRHTDQKLTQLTIENIVALTKPTELPGVVITCNARNDGQCFIQGTRLAMCGEYMYYPCEYVGYQEFSSYNPC